MSRMEDPPKMARTMTEASTMREMTMVRLKVYDGQEKIHDLELGSETASIGRDATSTIVLPDVSVSRRHAQVEPNGNFYLIRDNGSTNGTFVNEMLVRVQLLSHGDAIRVGRYVLRVESQSRQRQDSTRVRAFVEHLEAGFRAC